MVLKIVIPIFTVLKDLFRFYLLFPSNNFYVSVWVAVACKGCKYKLWRKCNFLLDPCKVRHSLILTLTLRFFPVTSQISIISYYKSNPELHPSSSIDLSQFLHKSLQLFCSSFQFHQITIFIPIPNINFQHRIQFQFHLVDSPSLSFIFSQLGFE